MGLLLSLACLYVPRPFRTRGLMTLFRTTADAFGIEPPSMAGLTYEERLRQYALFTMEQAERVLRLGTESEVRPRLYLNALKMGQQFRSRLHVGAEDVMKAAALIYRMLDVDFRGEQGGDIVITHCLFSGCYTSEVCNLISSLDEGLLVGLAGGGSFAFSQRITEGHDCCMARLEMGGGPP